MKPKKQIAFNKLFNFLVIVGILCGIGCLSLYTNKEIGWGIFFNILSVAFLVFPLFFIPCCYRFDSDGVTLCYAFLPNERYLWKNIYAIEVTFDPSVPSRAAILSWLFDTYFEISGKAEGELLFYMRGTIQKSLRTKRLLEQYWDGTITGYLLDDAKQWWRKRREKKEKQNASHLTDEIVPMERECRKMAREWLVPYVEQAEKNGLSLRAEYRYATALSAYHRSRPDQSYTYTLLLYFSRPNETDENRMFVLDIPLLYVRLGKTAYRGTNDPHAEERLHLDLDSFFDEVEKQGFEACLNAS